MAGMDMYMHTCAVTGMDANETKLTVERSSASRCISASSSA